MAIVKFDLSLWIRMDLESIRVCDCTAVLYHGVTRNPILKFDLCLDKDTCNILKDIYKKFQSLVANSILFIDCDVHSKTVRYSCDDLFSTSYYIGDRFALCSSGCSLALLFKILGKSDYIV